MKPTNFPGEDQAIERQLKKELDSLIDKVTSAPCHSQIQTMNTLLTDLRSKIPRLVSDEEGKIEIINDELDNFRDEAINILLTCKTSKV